MNKDVLLTEQRGHLGTEHHHIHNLEEMDEDDEEFIDENGVRMRRKKKGLGTKIKELFTGKKEDTYMNY
jgi:ribosomal protein L44E